ncbi:ubiquitin-specific protease OTU1 [Sporobolomyces koalae]|uniref:ubiquitin-specific protease OTU1 n=1 Tax=Sporobolomyces koalae TaxID=500713 RepID=UPI00317771D6
MIMFPAGTAACSLPDNADLSALHNEIYTLTAITPERQELRTGFPPKLLGTSTVQTTLLSALGIANGDAIVVAESATTASEIHQPATPASAPPSTVSASRAIESSSSNAPQYVQVDGGFLILRIVPDDNSCLFTAISQVLNPTSKPDPAALRRIVAETIQSDSSTYSQVLLGRPPSDYIATILSPKSWGGAIELSIFAKHFESEIWSIDVQTGRIDKFGEGSSYKQFAMVIYSGIHYDAVTYSYTPPSATISFPPNLEFDTTLFPLPASSDLISGAQTLVDHLRANHSYTDTATFTLQCQVCRTAIVGETDARKHAEQTGHQSFQEYNGAPRD